MIVASAGIAVFAPTDSIRPSRMMTTPFAISGPLTGCTVPPVIAYTPGASANAGAARRRRETTEKQRKRPDIRTSAARHDSRHGRQRRLPKAPLHIVLPKILRRGHV